MPHLRLYGASAKLLNQLIINKIKLPIPQKPRKNTPHKMGQLPTPTLPICYTRNLIAAENCKTGAA
jgi:hypothetical protein